MYAHRRVFGVVTIASVVCLAGVARGEIKSIAGTVAVEISEFRATSTSGTDAAEASYPDPNTALPLQVVARLGAVDSQAAGSVAAQFADPLTASGDNPEEFAINLTLNSLSPELYYTAHAVTEEVREVVFSAAEAGVPVGTTQRYLGRVYLDGVLAVFAVNDARDLSGVTLTVQVTVTQERADAEPLEVFAGTLTITGGAERQVSIAADGDMPTRGILDADLSDFDAELGVFRVFVLPNLVLSYPYNVTVGSPFTLRAKIQADAANVPDGVGVSVMLGTPLETFAEVVTLTRSAAAASAMHSAIAAEWAAPTGEPAFAPTPALLPACGLFGLESLLGPLGLLALRRRFVTH